MADKLVITFSSTHQALKAEDIFKELQLDFELIPTPREISAECGFALLVNDNNTVNIKETCDSNNIRFSGIYEILINDGVKYYEKSY